MLAVVTMEKANLAVNRLLGAGRLHELVCCVVDEAHMVADPSRWVFQSQLKKKQMLLYFLGFFRFDSPPPKTK
jgi:hypothetical protein